jgi:hypothetical protein
LNVCAHYLFKIGSCKASPECFCGFEIESQINNNFLHCPLFAAPRLKLLSSAAYIFADKRHAMTELHLIRVSLSGYSQLSENNIYIFHNVQSFIKETSRVTHVEP